MPEAVQATEANAHEIARGDRFKFGENWQRFLDVLDDARIAEAERSIREMLGIESLSGMSFLDIGSGSGLFSLAARRLGAKRVHSFDFDPASVACTRELRRRYDPGDKAWVVEQGSILDQDYVAGLGHWDVVYSWGVLHHTGSLWRALDLARSTVAGDGLLYISIYNDQGRASERWRSRKRTYNSLPPRLRLPYLLMVIVPYELRALALATARGRPMNYIRTWTEYKRSRGMSRWHDIVDWVGGYPFEVAKPEDVLNFLRARGFELTGLLTCGGGWGCNQYLFHRSTVSDAAGQIEQAVR